MMALEAERETLLAMVNEFKREHKHNTDDQISQLRGSLLGNVLRAVR